MIVNMCQDGYGFDKKPEAALADARLPICVVVPGIAAQDVPEEAPFPVANPAAVTELDVGLNNIDVALAAFQVLALLDNFDAPPTNTSILPPVVILL